MIGGILFELGLGICVHVQKSTSDPQSLSSRNGSPQKDVIGPSKKSFMIIMEPQRCNRAFCTLLSGWITF